MLLVLVWCSGSCRWGAFAEGSQAESYGDFIDGVGCYG